MFVFVQSIQEAIAVGQINLQFGRVSRVVSSSSVLYNYLFQDAVLLAAAAVDGGDSDDLPSLVNSGYCLRISLISDKSCRFARLLGSQVR